MPMPRCSMHMLWNTQIANTCVIFSSWHIRGWFTFALSLVVIALLGVTYEWLRKMQRIVDVQTAQQLSRVTSADVNAPESDETTLVLGQGPKLYPVPRKARILRASLYGLSTFLSFFLMLVFMTYNAYLIAAVVIGASLGHYIFGSHIEADSILSGVADPKGIACC